MDRTLYIFYFETKINKIEYLICSYFLIFLSTTCKINLGAFDWNYNSQTVFLGLGKQIEVIVSNIFSYLSDFQGASYVFLFYDSHLKMIFESLSGQPILNHFCYFKMIIIFLKIILSYLFLYNFNQHNKLYLTIYTFCNHYKTNSIWVWITYISYFLYVSIPPLPPLWSFRPQETNAQHTFTRSTGRIVESVVGKYESECSC